MQNKTAMAPDLAPARLEGCFVRLEPLRPDHVPALAAAASDRRIWRHSAFAKDADAYFDAALEAQARGDQIPFVVVKGGSPVGMSRLFEIDEGHKRCEIGYTWYIPEVWGTKVNPDAKLLLLIHCFETWDARRVQFKTDHENLRSQGAIEKLGAVREGVLRAHMIRPDGSQRDSVIYSITRAEWAKVKAGLEDRLR